MTIWTGRHQRQVLTLFSFHINVHIASMLAFDIHIAARSPDMDIGFTAFRSGHTGWRGG